MSLKSNSIRTFIGSKNFDESRKFYNELGFTEITIEPKMSYFRVEQEDDSMGFYLQDYYVKDWVENSMVFLEVQNLTETYELILTKELTKKYKNVKVNKIKNEPWGNVFHVIDPAGVLWHFAEFN